MSIHAIPFQSFFPVPAVEHVETICSLAAVQHVETPYSADNDDEIATIRHIIHAHGMRLSNDWFQYTIGTRTLEWQEGREEEIVVNDISNLDLSDILSPMDDDDHYIMEDDDHFDCVFDE